MGDVLSNWDRIHPDAAKLRPVDPDGITIQDSFTGQPLLFGPTQLHDALQAVIPQLPPGKQIATGFGLTKDGFGVGLVWARDTPTVDFEFKAAFRITLQGEKAGGIFGTISGD